MSIEHRTPLITGVTDKIVQRQKNTIPTSYAVGKTFTGVDIVLDIDKTLDDFVEPGIWRIPNDIAQATGHELPIDNIAGFLQVMDINHDEDGENRNTRRIRQIVFPDHLEESSPYTRVGQADTVTATITWSEWGMMGGGNLRRVIMTEDTEAKNNVLYESFGNHTLTLPNPKKVPVGTQIGVEQYVGIGRVVCEIRNEVTEEVVNTLEQVTEPDVTYDEDPSGDPKKVNSWTCNPYGDSGVVTSFGNRLYVGDPKNPTDHMKRSGTIYVDTAVVEGLEDNSYADFVAGYYYPQSNCSLIISYNGVEKTLKFKGRLEFEHSVVEDVYQPLFTNCIWESDDGTWKVEYEVTSGDIHHMYFKAGSSVVDMPVSESFSSASVTCAPMHGMWDWAEIGASARWDTSSFNKDTIWFRYYLANRESATRETGYTFLYYDVDRHTWVFSDNPSTMSSVTYFSGEYSVKVADAIAYIFECVLDEDGNREWALDVTHNYANAVNILSSRLHEVDTDVEHIKDYDIPTLGRKTIYHPTYIPIAANYSESTKNDEVELKEAVAATNDTYFYDHVVVVELTKSERTVVLPNISNTPLGARITYELVGGSTGVNSEGYHNCIIQNATGDTSQAFAVGPNSTVVTQFECSQYSGSAKEWTLLTVGGNLTIAQTAVADPARDPFVTRDAEVGSFMWWFGLERNIPSGWLVCNGQTLSATTYPQLAAILGATSENFQLPNLVDRFVKGSANTARTVQEAGLPNITGVIGAEGEGASGTNTGLFFQNSIKTVTGAFNKSTSKYWAAGLTTGSSYGFNPVTFDASKGTVGVGGVDITPDNSPYGKSNTVTPANITAIPLIKAKKSSSQIASLTSHVGMIFNIPGSVVPQGAYVLDGQTIDCSNGQHAAFWNYVNSANTVYKVTAARYEEILQEIASGSEGMSYCGAFVVDTSNKTVRLPKLNGAYIRAPFNDNQVGWARLSSLPNITGKFSGYTAEGTTTCDNVLFTSDNDTVKGPKTVDNNSEGRNTTTMDASKLHPIYGRISRTGDDDNIVRPPTIQYYWCIQVDPLEITVKTNEDDVAALRTQIQELRDLITTLQNN